MFQRTGWIAVLAFVLIGCDKRHADPTSDPCEEQADQVARIALLRPAEADSIATLALRSMPNGSDAPCWASLMANRIFCAALRGDSTVSDSLLGVLLTHHGQRRDAEACLAYCKAGEGWYRRSHIARAERLLDSAVVLGHRGGNAVALANALCSRASLALDVETPEKAVAMNMEALLALGTTPADTAVLIRLYSNLGHAHGWQGALDSAVHYHLRAIDLLNIVPNDQKLAWNRMNLGVVLADQGNYLPAIGLFQDALHFYEHERAVYEIGACLHYLAYCQQHVLTADRVVRNYERAIAIYDSIGQEPRSMLVRMALGRYLIDLDSTQCATIGMSPVERDDLAQDLCSRALAIGRRYPIPGQLADALDGLCDVERSLGQNDSALAHARQAITFREKLGDKGRLAGSYKDLGAAYRAMGRPNEAEQAYRAGLDLIAQAPHPENAANLHQELQLFYAAQGRFREAHSHLLESHRLRNNLMDEEKRQEVVQRQLQFDFSRTQLADSLRHAERLRDLEEQRELADLRAEKGQRNTWLATGALLMLVLGGSVFHQLDRRRRRERFAKESAQLEAKALRAQMDPHFIGNTLHAVNGYLLTNDTATASTMLSRFANWIRRTLESSRQEEIPLRDEIEAMRTYLALEQLRTKEKFAYRIEVPEDDELLRTRIPPMLVQPFLENAIQHGVLPKDGAGEIQLRIVDKGGHLQFVVEDNGVGRSPSVGQADTTTRSSLSTTITRERLRLLGDRTGRPAGVRVIDLAPGTRVEIDVPLG